VRGALSDILSIATLERMRGELRALRTVTVARVGHAPTLEEPVAQRGIAALLAKLA
jgi:pimeloyl-ACP methyl ester carboxylesterase